ncbi:uncharacterized protein C8A04DRAFT_25189 [Dichotomopilus funicola]|uniref:Uncharacterized protein n=1 Tax=Dichotomopilus funicola TaxID=1934379 RepID=A0AAN6V912_9PEZI|nr:hypothetical protein C8A04DRAFT_25189 [Dichotomopilus funicola]
MSAAERIGQAGNLDQMGVCMVAALFVPSTAGAYIFLSTVPKGPRRQGMLSKGYQKAPTWWAAIERKSKTYCHAEDGAEHDFEEWFRLNRSSLPHISLATDPKNGFEYFRVRDRDNELSPLKLAVWGCYKRERDPNLSQLGHFVELCTSGDKQPNCQEVARRLKIEFCTRDKLDAEFATIEAEREEGFTGPPMLYTTGYTTYHSTGHSTTGGGNSSNYSYNSSSYRAGPSSSQGQSYSAAPRAAMHSQARSAAVSDLTERMSSLSVRSSSSTRQPRFSTATGNSGATVTGGRSRNSSAQRDSYWEWDSERRRYFHREANGRTTWRS